MLARAAGTVADTSHPATWDRTVARKISAPATLVARNTPLAARLASNSSFGSGLPTKSAWRSDLARMMPFLSVMPVIQPSSSRCYLSTCSKRVASSAMIST